MNLLDHLFKPLVSIPIQIAHLTTSVAIPVPGFRNIADDALKWINPNAYESQEKLRDRISIVEFRSQSNIWKWIFSVLFIMFILKSSSK